MLAGMRSRPRRSGNHETRSYLVNPKADRANYQRTPRAPGRTRPLRVVSVAPFLRVNPLSPDSPMTLGAITPRAAMMRVPAPTVCVILCVGLLAAASRAPRPANPASPGHSDLNATTTQAATVETGASIPFEEIAHPKPGTWPTYHGHLSGNRFSPLDQIDSSNVHHLAPRWMFTIHGAP